MNKRPLFRVLATVLLVSFLAPATFFIAPRKANASAASCIGGLLGGIGLSAATAVTAVPVQNLSIQGSTALTGGATTGSCINDVILIPLAKMAIRVILQQMTASVVNWISGKNGTGQPSFAVNLSATLRSVGDAVAIPFINQITAGLLNTPFSQLISSALAQNYSQGTSLAGFFAANRCTLSQSSRNVQAFLQGRWSQGGAAAWLSLSTQPQNNPYMLYDNSLAAMANAIGSGAGGAIGKKIADLNWGSGFTSWCGVTDTAQNTATIDYAACRERNIPEADCTQASGGATAEVQGINPGDPCTKNGISGKVQTPGSVIHEYTTKAVVSSGFDQLISANDLDAALGQIIGALANRVLGGVGGALGGLFGASQSSGSTPSLTSQLANYTGSSSNATNASGQTAQDMATRVTAYKTAWNTITNSANTAKTSINSLINTCTTNANTAKTQLATQTDPTAKATLQTFIDASTAQVSAAQTALTYSITPVFSQANTASAAVAATSALLLRVQTESATAASTLASDVATLVQMPPSVIDINNVQSGAVVSGGAVANPDGSLTVSRGTLVDQMNLISTNAITLQTSVCTIPTDLGAGGGGGGGGGGGYGP